MIVSVFISLLTIVAFYCYYVTIFHYWKRKNVEVPTLVVPILGNIWPLFSFRASLGQWLRHLYNCSKAPFCGFYIFSRPYLLIRDPDLIQTILVTNFSVFSDRTFDNVNKKDQLGTLNLLTIKNPEWSWLRKKLSPMYSLLKLKQLFPLINDVGRNLKTHILNNSVNNEYDIDAKVLSNKYTTDVITSCAFGIEGQALTNPNAEFFKLGNDIFNFTIHRAFDFYAFFFSPFLVKLFNITFFGKSSKRLSNIFWETLNYRKSCLDKRTDLIDILINLMNTTRNDETGSFLLQGDALVAQAGIFFIAGFETSSTVMGFTLYNLALHPEIQKKVRKEIIQVLSKHNNEITYENLNEMTYLKMCVDETLRLYAPVQVINRRCINDFQIPGTDLIIKEGTGIFIGADALHRDPKYFPDPLKFIPERFSEENKDNILPFTYLPFGEGPRYCVGKRFAYLQTWAGLVYILKDHRVEVTSETNYPIKEDRKAFVMKSVNGIPLKLINDQMNSGIENNKND